jgi:tetratricopeptide repeat protein
MCSPGHGHPSTAIVRSRFRRATAIDEKNRCPDHEEVAADLDNRGRSLHSIGALIEAEPLYRRALAINEKTFGPEHPDTANSVNNLALLLRDTNRLGDAAAFPAGPFDS